MSEYLTVKQDRYKFVSASECFRSGLMGLFSIELNVSEMCSRRCKFCPRHDSSVYKNRPLYMGLDTAEILNENLLKEKYAGNISITGFGEPLLHPNICGIVRALRNHYTIIITNGDFLTSEMMDSLVSAGLKKIVVSSYDSAEESARFRTLLSQFKIEFHVKDLWYDFNSVVRQNEFNNRSGLAPVPSIGEFKECYLPFYKMFVDWNGEICLCASDWWRRESGFGNIHNKSLREIWLGTRLTEIRKELSKGRRTSKACINCTAKGTVMGKESFELLTHFHNTQDSQGSPLTSPLR